MEKGRKIWGQNIVRVEASKSEILKARKNRERRTICPHFVYLFERGERKERSRSQFSPHWTFYSYSSQISCTFFLGFVNVCIRRNKNRHREQRRISSRWFVATQFYARKDPKILERFLSLSFSSFPFSNSHSLYLLLSSNPNNDFLKMEASKIWTLLSFLFYGWISLQKKP